MEPQGQQSPLMAILAKARAQGAGGPGGAPAGMAASDPEMQMPMSKDTDSGSLLVNRALFKQTKVKPGDTITVTGKVTSIGNKIGFSPSGVEKMSEEPEEIDTQDEDLEEVPTTDENRS